MLAQVGPPAAPEVFEVYGPNVTAVQLFAAMRTQWNAVAFSTLDRAILQRTGLRYEVLDRVARGLGVEERPGDFAKLQHMEAAALLAWARSPS